MKKMYKFFLAFITSLGFIGFAYSLGGANILYLLGLIPRWLELVSYFFGFACLYASISIFEMIIKNECDYDD